MTRKSKNKASLPSSRGKSANKSKTPFADAGDIVGKRLANMFNMPQLRGVGKWLGSGIGQIFGSGDYQMVGQSPSYNLLTNDRQIPKFSSTERTNIVCHREYLGTISGTTAFTNREFRLNPGDGTTFPWLSTVASSYQEYRFHGLIFEFRSLLTDYVASGAPGVTIFATNYNSSRPAYTSKIAMENSEYAVSTKPTVNMVHAIECKSNETVLEKLYVRDSTLTTEDAKFYDLGKTQIATQGNPVQMIGEIWVSYCVEFFKPKLSTDIAGDISSALVVRSTTNSGAPLGTIFVSSDGDLSVSTTPTSALIQKPSPGAYYEFTISWNYVGPAAWVTPSVSFTNSTLVTGNYGYTFPATQLGPVTNWFVIKVSDNLDIGQAAGVVFDTAGTIPNGAMQILISECSTAIA